MSDTQPNEELLIEENRKQFDALLVDPKFEGWAAAINRGRWSFEDFTCHNCPVCKECRSAFDFYNTDGDCLEMK